MKYTLGAIVCVIYEQLFICSFDVLGIGIEKDMLQAIEVDFRHPQFFALIKTKGLENFVKVRGDSNVQ